MFFQAAAPGTDDLCSHPVREPQSEVPVDRQFIDLSLRSRSFFFFIVLRPAPCNRITGAGNPQIPGASCLPSRTGTAYRVKRPGSPGLLRPVQTGEGSGISGHHSAGGEAGRGSHGGTVQHHPGCLHNTHRDRYPNLQSCVLLPRTRKGSQTGHC